MKTVHLCVLALALLHSHLLCSYAQTFTTIGGSNTWNTATNWTPAVVPNGVGVAVTFNTPASNTSASLVGINPTVGSILFNDTGATTISITSSGGGPLIFEETNTGPASITTTGTGTGNNTISSTMKLNDSLAAIVNNTNASSAAGSLNLTGTVSGPGGFTKLGDGLATFGTGAKNYTGPTVLSGGRMRMSNAGSPTATASFTIEAGGQLDLISAAIFTFGSGPLDLNGAGPTSGPFAVFPGAIRNDRGLIITINNAVVLQSDTLVHVQATAGTGTNASPAGSTTFTGPISGPGKLMITAPNSDIEIGSVILTAKNTYTGGTLVNGGLLIASGAAASFGAGDVTVDHAASPASIARLVIQSGVTNAIADTAFLTLAGGGAPGVADQGYANLGAGVNEVIGGLKLGGSLQPAGTYGSSASPATYKNDEYFAGTGIITVVPINPPTLAITADGANVVLAWPANSGPFHLENTTSLSGVSIWQTNESLVIVSGTNNTVTEPATNASIFYRLNH